MVSVGVVSFVSSIKHGFVDLPPSLSSSRMSIALFSTTLCALEDWEETCSWVRSPAVQSESMEGKWPSSDPQPSSVSVTTAPGHLPCLLGGLCATRAAGQMVGWGRGGGGTSKR